MRPGAAVAALICLALLAGCRQPGFPSAGQPSAGLPTAGLPATAPAPITLSASPGSYLGVYENGAPLSYRPVATFAKAVRRQPRLAMYFSGWNDDFQIRFAQQAHAHGVIPLVQMEPTNISLAAIAAGRYDAYLISYADQVRAYGHPVVISFAHEMNGWWYSWGYGHTSPKVWVKAWRHLVTVFRQQGAVNVTWLWAIDRSPLVLSVVPRYWPGASYVNWVGIDGYYFQPSDTFQTIFAPVIRKVRTFTNKPIFLAETAAGPVSGQAVKVTDLFAGIREHHLLGLLWYDVAQHDGPYHQDWRLEGHAAALTAFRRGLSKMHA